VLFRSYSASKDDAYNDYPHSIGHGATISAPHMHAMCLELVRDCIHPGSHILDVGSGSGYLVSSLARLLIQTSGGSLEEAKKAGGHVYGIEHIQQLVDQSQLNVNEDSKELNDILTIQQGDGRVGYESGAPFDVIHVGAAADIIPEPLIQQLKVGGKLVIPVGPQTFSGQELLLIRKKEDGKIEKTTITGVRYVPLTTQQAQLASY